MKRAEILDAAKACVCGEREQDYGTPEDSFGLIGQLWTVYMGTPVSYTHLTLPTIQSV